MNRQDDAPRRYRRAKSRPWFVEGFASWLCHRLAFAGFIITTVHFMVGLFVELPLEWWHLGLCTLGCVALSIAFDRLQDDDDPVPTDVECEAWSEQDERDLERNLERERQRIDREITATFEAGDRAAKRRFDD